MSISGTQTTSKQQSSDFWDQLLNDSLQNVKDKKNKLHNVTINPNMYYKISTALKPALMEAFKDVGQQQLSRLKNHIMNNIHAELSQGKATLLGKYTITPEQLNNIAEEIKNPNSVTWKPLHSAIKSQGLAKPSPRELPPAPLPDLYATVAKQPVQRTSSTSSTDGLYSEVRRNSTSSDLYATADDALGGNSRTPHKVTVPANHKHTTKPKVEEGIYARVIHTHESKKTSKAESIPAEVALKLANLETDPKEKSAAIEKVMEEFIELLAKPANNTNDLSVQGKRNREYMKTQLDKHNAQNSWKGNVAGIKQQFEALAAQQQEAAKGSRPASRSSSISQEPPPRPSTPKPAF